MTADRIAPWKHLLYQRALARPNELAEAAHALLGGLPEAEGQAELLDFFVLEWVDAEGWTEVEHAVRAGQLPAEALRWTEEVRTSLWVVDGWEGDQVLLRDLRSEQEVAVRAPGAEADLPRRTVLRARLIPTDDGTRFSGAPDIWEPMGVIARMDLLQEWLATPEPDLLERLAALRAAFRRQREEREAWVAHFGADLVIFADAADMDRRLARFVSYLHNEHGFPSLGGRTRADAHRAAKGADPVVVQFALGPTLSGAGRPGAIYDTVEGIHFLPSLGEFMDHVRGAAEHPEVLRLYLEDPGITRLPFARASTPDALLRAPGADEPEPIDAVLDRWKPAGRRPTPSTLPGLDA